MPPGQTTVPASASTSTWAKYRGSLSGSRTPVQCSLEKSTSPTVPSLNRSRSTWSPSTATPTTAGRYFSLTVPILRQGFYVEQRLVLPGSLPVRQDLLIPEPRPLPDEPQSPTFEAAGEHRPVRRDRRAAPGMVGMKVGHGVISFVPVHVDHDPVERADTRHGMTIAQLRVPGGLAALATRNVRRAEGVKNVGPPHRRSVVQGCG